VWARPNGSFRRMPLGVLKVGRTGGPICELAGLHRSCWAESGEETGVHRLIPAINTSKLDSVLRFLNDLGALASI
jgi:hypothetical protein